jgi:hypothetical protein
MTEKTLREYYREELDKGKAAAVFEVGKLLYNKCLDGDSSSIMFYLKTQGRYSETHKSEISGKDGGAIALLLAEVSGRTLGPEVKE